MATKRYWIDSGVLIQAEHGLYSQKMLPQFWSFLHEQLEAGTVKMPRLCCKDIIDGGYTDVLQTWCKNRKNMGLSVNETRAVTTQYGHVMAHVQRVYKDHPPKIREFMACTDGWLIAYALADEGSTLVTNENTKARGKIKIPTVCNALDVRCIDTIKMMKELDADFSEGSLMVAKHDLLKLPDDFRKATCGRCWRHLRPRQARRAAGRLRRSLRRSRVSAGSRSRRRRQAPTRTKPLR